MEKNLRKIISGTVCTMFFFCGIITAHAYCIMAAGGFTPYPTKIVSAKGFASDVNSAITKACAEWNSTEVGKLVTRSSSTHSTSRFPYENDANEITALNQGTVGGMMETKQTQYKIVGLKVYNTEVDININTAYPWATDGDVNAFDVQNCFTHELGHLLGLDDEDSKTSSTMYGEAARGETKKRTLATDDINGLLEIYG